MHTHFQIFNVQLQTPVKSSNINSAKNRNKTQCLLKKKNLDLLSPLFTAFSLAETNMITHE